jgi:agmatine deiminase
MSKAEAMAVPQSARRAPFHMPAEWEPHEATWLAWPHNSRDWPGKFAPIHWVYTEIIRYLQRHERVSLLVQNKTWENRARRMLAQIDEIDLSRITFHRFSSDRSWLRDTAPSFVKRGASVAAACWKFNGWAKYGNWKKDAALGPKIAQAAKARVLEPCLGARRVVLEGGAIDVNGCGTLLTTEECLLGDVQQRNPGMTRAQWEQVFAAYLGIRKVLWLGRGIAGDDTHGHVDDLARFVGPRTIVTVVENDPSDVNFEPLRENLLRLQKMTDQDDHLLEIVPLPMPRPIYFQGVRVPASYANFYIANGIVLAPTFNDPNDRLALDTLAGVFPERQVVGIHSVDLVWGFGTLHCATQQQPATE